MGFNPVAVGLVNRVVGVFVLVIGAALLIWGGYWISQKHEFIASSVSAEGKVIQNRAEQASGASRASYRAIVTFSDQKGQVVTYNDSIAFNPPVFKEGEAVKILYDPHNPRDAMIDRGAKNYLIPGALCLLGGIFILGGVQRLRMSLI